MVVFSILKIFREKLANIYMKPDDDDNQSPSSSDDDDDDFDSQIGSSVNESFDTGNFPIFQYLKSLIFSYNYKANF